MITTLRESIKRDIERLVESEVQHVRERFEETHQTIELTDELFLEDFIHSLPTSTGVYLVSLDLTSYARTVAPAPWINELLFDWNQTPGRVPKLSQRVLREEYGPLHETELANMPFYLGKVRNREIAPKNDGIQGRIREHLIRPKNTNTYSMRLSDQPTRLKLSTRVHIKYCELEGYGTDDLYFLVEKMEQELRNEKAYIIGG
ncbi:hypothetical protein FLK61_38115 [Paenalkalicoccus suaedae]|uniref:Uncharacterized protein n=1 Tax=Paenalkalicoccus suaedae TaxID=2592382 RepID=A0A859FH44_9BACI|nr:hypothetical protein [Paenalkalicoccus suaedae]QKS72447.1 hypothetical protein FLK61_38115 [Paenalkalicoccus suaedae]